VGSVKQRPYKDERAGVVKAVPTWVNEREALKRRVEEPLVFVGKWGADGVVDGLLPNGEPYLWTKRRGTKDTKYKGRKK
jgi:hypothetical protein